MPPKTKTEVKEKFALVQQSYEDREFEGKAMLVPAKQTLHQFRSRKPREMAAIRFGEDLELDEDEFERGALLVCDDAVEGRLFEDEVEEDFDEDFIRQMMSGEGVEGFNFDDDDDDAGAGAGAGAGGPEGAGGIEYPRHDERRAEEKQFDKMMADFDMDEDINTADVGDDPRARGALSVEDYAPALEAFVEEHAGSSLMTGEHAVRHRGFMQQLNIISRNNAGGLLNLPGRGDVLQITDRRARDVEEFMQASEDLRQDMLEALRRKQIRDSDISVGARVADAMSRAVDADGNVLPMDQQETYDDMPQIVKDAMSAAERRSERIDCETVLTTLTNTFNLPNVIAVDPSKRLKPPKKRHRSPPPEKKTKPSGSGTPNYDDDDFDEDEFGLDNDVDGDEALRQQRILLSSVPTDETKEEKKQRRALFKLMQREARAAKKQLKDDFKKTGVEQSNNMQKSQSDRRTTTLSSIRGNMLAQ